MTKTDLENSLCSPSWPLTLDPAAFPSPKAGTALLHFHTGLRFVFVCFYFHMRFVPSNSSDRSGGGRATWIQGSKPRAASDPACMNLEGHEFATHGFHPLIYKGTFKRPDTQLDAKMCPECPMPPRVSKQEVAYKPQDCLAWPPLFHISENPNSSCRLRGSGARLNEWIC